MTSGRPSCKCEKALPGGCGVKCKRRSESSRGRCGSVRRAQGPGQAGWHLLCWLLPMWAAGSSVEGDVLHLDPRGHGSSQLRAAGVPFSSCCSVVGSVPRPDIQPRTEGRSYNKNELPSGTSTSRGTWTGDERPLQRRPHCPQNTRVVPVEEGCRQGPAVNICVI